MCATDIYRARIRSYLPNKKRNSKCLLPIVYQEDLLMKPITGGVYVCISGQFFLIDLDLDELIFSQVREETVTILYLSKGQLWLYQALANNLKCRDYYLVEGSYDLNILHASCVPARDTYHLVLVREENIITYLSITLFRPCELNKALQVTETALDTNIPVSDRIKITSIAIGLYRPASVKDKVRLALYVVTSSQWLYHYNYEEGNTQLLTKYPNIILVTNYNRQIVILDSRGNISSATGSYSYRTDWTCQYTLRQGRYYIKHKDRNNKLYTLRNYISYQLRRSHQVTIPTTLAKLEFYRCRHVNK